RRLSALIRMQGRLRREWGEHFRGHRWPVGDGASGDSPATPGWKAGQGRRGHCGAAPLQLTTRGIDQPSDISVFLMLRVRLLIPRKWAGTGGRDAGEALRLIPVRPAAAQGWL